MSKTEMLRQSAEAAIATRNEALAAQIQGLQDAKIQNAEELSALLEPLAQALASLSEAARKTLLEVDSKAHLTSEEFERRLDQASVQLDAATTRANQAATRLSQAGGRLDWSHYGLTVATGLLAAVLVSVFWLWYQPPTVQATVDVKALAEGLRPALIPAPKPGRSK